MSGSLDMDQDGQHVPVQDRAIWTSLVSSSSKVRCRGARNAHRSGPLRAFYRLRRRTAAVSREQLREGSALSNRDFDSTPAGVCVALTRGLWMAARGCEARSPRHTGPRSLVIANAIGGGASSVVSSELPHVGRHNHLHILGQGDIRDFGLVGGHCRTEQMSRRRPFGRRAGRRTAPQGHRRKMVERSGT